MLVSGKWMEKYIQLSLETLPYPLHLVIQNSDHFQINFIEDSHKQHCIVNELNWHVISRHIVDII